MKWHVYHTFVTSAYKGALVPVLLLFQVLFQGLQIGSNYWISWATEKEDQVSKEKLIGIFVLLSASSSMFILGRGVLLATVAFETAQKLFLGMITSIFRAPMSFFDTTPSSRILNRVSSLIFSLSSLLSGQKDISLLFPLISKVTMLIYEALSKRFKNFSSLLKYQSINLTIVTFSSLHQIRQPLTLISHTDWQD